MRWTWDAAKSEANRAKHGVSFDLARLVFDDPLHLSQPDPHADGDRWQTVGQVGPALLFVVHTWADDEVVESRLISARRGTRQERRAYEQGS
jgi:uncharacterized protein